MKRRKMRYFIGDFETTVYKGQVNTEVWASASVELFTEDVKIFHSIGEQFEYLKSLNSNIVCYFHNLKFDGSFWLSYFLVDLELKQALENPEATQDTDFTSPKEMANNTFSYSISSMGQWYRITVKINNKIIEFRDSLKLLPFSVKRIGNSFATKHKKLDMEYKGFRHAGCSISDEEKEYIKNDVLVVKEAIEIMFNEGHNKLTIGSCCLAEYIKSISKPMYEILFPDVYEIELPKIHEAETVGDWIRKSYKGGWCYLAKGKEKQVYTNGTTADVNSLYPSMMSSESGNRYPVGRPVFWEGNIIPNIALSKENYYFVRIRTRFYIKKDYLPFIQIKNNLLYKGTECLETSDVYNKEDGKYYPQYIDLNGNVKEAIVTLTLTMTDYELIKEHYELVDFEILDGCYFESKVGIFDEYIEKYKKIKVESKGAQRELAKLFLNNLYGKMASSRESDFKVAYVKPDKSLAFYTVISNNKKAGYIPVGSAITSYARNFTIRAAQKNYHGKNKRGFIYADTDSIHCDLEPEQIVGIKTHNTSFCCWKLESQWDTGLFVRQKTYIEHIVKEDGEKIEKPYYSVKCAGMPERCKDLFIKSLQGYTPKPEDNYSEEQLKFLETKRELTDFTTGLTIHGKLLPKRIRGGVLLVDTTYEMR